MASDEDLLIASGGFQMDASQNSIAENAARFDDSINNSKDLLYNASHASVFGSGAEVHPLGAGNTSSAIGSATPPSSAESHPPSQHAVQLQPYVTHRMGHPAIDPWSGHSSPDSVLTPNEGTTQTSEEPSASLSATRSPLGHHCLTHSTSSEALMRASQPAQDSRHWQQKQAQQQPHPDSLADAYEATLANSPHGHGPHPLTTRDAAAGHGGHGGHAYMPATAQGYAPQHGSHPQAYYSHAEGQPDDMEPGGDGGDFGMHDMASKQSQQRLWAMRSASAKQLAAATALARGNSGSGGQQPSLMTGPDRDYSTELLLRDAMYPAMRQAMYPSLKLPELSADAGNISASPAQTASDLRWPQQHPQQPQHPQQGGAWPAGQYGEGVPDYGSHAGSAAGGGSSSFFERAFMGGPGGEGPRPSALARGWHANSTPALVGLENANVAAAAAAAAAVAAAPGPGPGCQGPLSPRQWQTGPAWDQMPAAWHPQGGFNGAGGGGDMAPMYGGPGMMGQRDAGDGFPGPGVGAQGTAWMRGGSHPQLAGLARNSRGVYAGSSGSMQALGGGGGGSPNQDLWKQRNASAASLSQIGAAAASALARAPAEHPLGEYPSRTLFVRNINIHTTDEELLTLFSQCGEVRSMYTACKHRGFVMISYHDIRASTRAKQVLQGFMLRQRAVDVHYSVPKENASEPDLNQGTLVVFNMDSSIPRGRILELFSQFGEVKEIRSTPKKEGHKFVEFYDSRHAHAALQGLNRVTLAGRQLKIELSRPGGVRRARNSQQNLQALHSENSSSQTDLLNAGSLGSGEALPPVSGAGSGGGGSGQVLSPSAGDLQAMFQTLMIQGAAGGGQPPPPPPPPPHVGGGLHVVPPPGPGMSGQFMTDRRDRVTHGGAADSFSTPPDTPGGLDGLDEGPLGPRRGWAPPPPPPPAPSSGGFPQTPMSDSAAMIQGMYSGLMKQSVPPPGHPPPEGDVDGAYQSLVSSMLGTGSTTGGNSGGEHKVGSALAAGQPVPPPPPPPPPPSDTGAAFSPIAAPPPPPISPQLPPLQAARGVSSPKHQQQQPPPPPPPPPNQLPPQPPPSAGGSPMAAGTPSHGGGGPSPNHTLPATLAAAAASAAAALARDPTIPPEEHEARLHQHLLEQLGHMHRHAVGQMVMEQQVGGPMQSPSWHMGGLGTSHGGSPCSSLPHSPRVPPAGHRGPHPLAGAHFPPSPPPPAPLSVDGDSMSPGRGSGRPMSPMHANGRSAPRPISARHSRSPLAGGGPHSTASSLPASVAGSCNSVGDYIEHGSGRRGSNSGEHFAVSREAVGNGPGLDARTTLMIRNIPNKYTQKVLMQTIDDGGFFGKYDFFYLPIDFKNHCNVGYSFINMASTDAVLAFYDRFHNQGWERFNSEKRCCVAYARIQTRSALVSHFQNSSLMHEDKKCRPVLINLSGAAPIFEEFPAPRRQSHSSHSSARRAAARSGRPSRDSLDSPKGGRSSLRTSADARAPHEPGGGSGGTPTASGGTPTASGGGRGAPLSQEFPFCGARDSS
eukprot:jgi/Ulvmu1/11765/UM008_0179.1